MLKNKITLPGLAVLWLLGESTLSGVRCEGHLFARKGSSRTERFVRTYSLVL